MGILANILGGSDVIKAVTEVIDAVHTSDEEELRARADAKVKLIQAYAPFKLAQRYLALLFCATYLMIFWMVMAVTLWNDGGVNEIISVMAEFKIAYIVLLIIGFYFGGGFTEGIVEKVRKGK